MICIIHGVVDIERQVVKISEKSVVDYEATTHGPTSSFINWLQDAAASNAGVIPQYTKLQAAVAMGITDSKSGVTRGRIQSRIDFACYRLGFPPLGLVASDHYKDAWGDDGTGIKFSEARLMTAARTRTWAEDDFVQIKSLLSGLPTGSGKMWKDEAKAVPEKIQAWADSFLHFEEWKVATPLYTDKNPAWTRDELILALHLYLHHRSAIPSKSSVEVLELSHLLNTIGNSRAKGKTYRNVSGVYMKLMNFRSIDPQYTALGKVGLTRNNKDEPIVWDLFAHDLPRLDAVVAALIAATLCDPASIGIDDLDEDEIEDCEEGRVLTRMHRYRERDRDLAVRFKAKVRRGNGGVLACGGCDLDYLDKYGDVAERLIDVHHTKPIHTMLPGEKTREKDLVLLCVSCHRAVHSRRQWLQIPELRRLLTISAERLATRQIWREAVR